MFCCLWFAALMQPSLCDRVLNRTESDISHKNENAVRIYLASCVLINYFLTMLHLSSYFTECPSCSIPYNESGDPSLSNAIKALHLTLVKSNIYKLLNIKKLRILESWRSSLDKLNCKVYFVCFSFFIGCIVHPKIKILS